MLDWDEVLRLRAECRAAMRKCEEAAEESRRLSIKIIERGGPLGNGMARAYALEHLKECRRAEEE